MTAWLIVSILFAGLYLFIQLRYLSGWNDLPEWRIPSDFQPKTKVSVVIPARNEGRRISACLHSVLSQSYPASLFEIILIDDHSEDETFSIVQKIAEENSQLRALRLADFVKPEEVQSFKKKAIETGIAHAKGELIVCTDADCIVPFNWLSLLVSFFEKNNPAFIAAPVNFFQEKTLLERFQSLDLLGMMVVTAAGIHLRTNQMCNGANLAYPKAAFQELNGFQNIDSLASGDDMLLMQKIAARYPERIGFLKSSQAVAQTLAKPDLRSFISQRLRWATKTSSYRDRRVAAILALVFLYCLTIILSFFFSIWWGWKAIILASFLWMVKALADYFVLRNAAYYFERKDLIKSFLPSQVLHLIYIAGIGLAANFVRRYTWKGRRVK